MSVNIIETVKDHKGLCATLLALVLLAIVLGVAADSIRRSQAKESAASTELAKVQADHLKEMNYAEARLLEADKAVDELGKINAGLADELKDLKAKLGVQTAQVIHGEGSANATMQCPVQDPIVVHEVSYIPTKVQLTLSTDVAEVRAADGKLYFKGVNWAVVKDALDKTTMLDVKIPFEAAKSYVIEAQPVPEPALRPAELTVGLGPLAALGRTNALGGAVSLNYASKERRLSKTLTTRGWGATALVGYAGGDGIAYLGASKTFDLRGRR